MDAPILGESRFPYSRFEIDILLSFLEEDTIAKVAQRLHKDSTVVTRQIQNMTAVQPLFEKQGRKWQLSPFGRRVAERFRTYLLDLQEVCKSRARIILVTTPDFGSRILPDLLGELEELNVFFDVICSHSSIERLLLDGKADLAIECGRPFSPSIRFKQIVPESLSLIYPKTWNIESLDQILKRPAIHYLRINLPSVLNLKESLPESKFRTNNISVAVELVRLRKGWTIVPTYTVKSQLARRDLRVFDVSIDSQLKFGIWWPAERPVPSKVLQKLSASLARISLE